LDVGFEKNIIFLVDLGSGVDDLYSGVYLVVVRMVSLDPGIVVPMSLFGADRTLDLNDNLSLLWIWRLNGPGSSASKESCAGKHCHGFVCDSEISYSQMGGLGTF
jgi:hypothetical protein